MIVLTMDTTMPTLMLFHSDASSGPWWIIWSYQLSVKPLRGKVG